MKITTKWLDKWNACEGGREYFAKAKISDPLKLAARLILDDQLEWCNWMLARILNRENKIRYACFAARQVLDIFEKGYPKDKRPRLAIEAAEKWIKDNSEAASVAASEASEASRAASRAASEASRAASWAACVAASVAASEASWAASVAASWAASEASWAASVAASWAASEASWAASRAACVAASEAACVAASEASEASRAMKTKILNYGIKLFKGK